MTRELLPYYNGELDFLRREAEKFASQHPVAAAQLGLSSGAPPDPHVERLLQGVAFLNARVHHRLDDDFPELVESLLNTLCPQYLAPFPSCAIAEFSLQGSQAGPDSVKGNCFPAVETVIQSSPDPSDGSRLEYRTAYDVNLLPLRVADARYRPQPFACPAGTRADEAAALLHLELETLRPELSISQLALKTLRLYLSGQFKPVSRLYELLLRCSLQIVLCNDLERGEVVVLNDPGRHLEAVGFSEKESLLPLDARVLPGHRLLREYFAFPQKFHFVDLHIPPTELQKLQGTKLHVLFLLKEHASDLEPLVRGDTFRLHATPVVNLFKKPVSPIRLTRSRPEYPIEFDDPNPLDFEVFSINRVTATSSRATQERRNFKSFYDIDRGSSSRQTHGYWRLSRRRLSAGDSSQDGRTDAEPSLQGWLSLTDLELQSELAGDWVLHVDAVCVNRAPHRRWSGALSGQFARDIWSLSNADSVGNTRLVTVPTPPLRWPAEKGWRWRILSHLTLNHLSLDNSTSGAAALREILELYNPAGSKVIAEQIRGILSISCRRVTRRFAAPARTTAGTDTPGSPPGRQAHDSTPRILRGMEATLHLDAAAFPQHDLFLFGSILREFLGSYCSINSFVETVLKTSQSEGEFHRWPANAGTRSRL